MESLIKYKTCTKCNNVFPNTADFFHKSGTDKDGNIKLRASCKSCNNNSFTFPVQYIIPNTKTCTKCGKIFPCTSEYFHKHCRNKDGFKYECKLCSTEYKNLQYVKENHKQYIKIHQKNNPEIYQKATSKYRSKKENILETYSVEDILYTKTLFTFKCFNCNSTDRLEIDHFYPLSKGNALTRKNAILLCRSCNAKKRDKLPVNFFTQDQLNDLQNNYGIII